MNNKNVLTVLPPPIFDVKTFFFSYISKYTKGFLIVLGLVAALILSRW